ncbi:MAG TPA: hypothetical protein VKQ30_25825 [Ktedonobacterales bacterium]|nr:hypothetical protein [Ktedonobacterales bacterium]
MHNNRIDCLRRLLLCLMLAASVTPMTLPDASVAHADGSGSLSISPGVGVVGSRFHLQGTGFQNFSLITHDLNVTAFDASNTIVDEGSVTAGDDGSIEVDIDTSSGSYTNGTYWVLATYTYWGARHDPADPQRILCDFCPTKTVPLADSVTFTLQ